MLATFPSEEEVRLIAFDICLSHGSPALPQWVQHVHAGRGLCSETLCVVVWVTWRWARDCFGFHTQLDLCCL